MTTTNTLSDSTIDRIYNSLTFGMPGFREAGGAWIKGEIFGHTFCALVFPEHADHEDYEIARSRISKLEVRRKETRKITIHWDRGWDVEPQTAIDRAILGAICDETAAYVYDE